ncbi:MAG: hypothetical protein M1827_000065 [Pycnora praestabilis]|nr:MAG: hypothetical protein M1827_000065 [Pycnora praestabilis]
MFRYMQQRFKKSALVAVALLLNATPLAIAHGHGAQGDVATSADVAPRPVIATSPGSTAAAPSSYFQYPLDSGLMYAHIAIMTIGVMLSISRSRLTVPIQVSFLLINALGLLLGTVYNSRTPNLYENNIHHTLGWAVTWIIAAQFLIGIISLRCRQEAKRSSLTEEQSAFLPVSLEAMKEHQRTQAIQASYEHRYSNDSGQGTERTSSSSSHSEPLSPAEEDQRREPLQFPVDEDMEGSPQRGGETEKSRSRISTALNQFLLGRISRSSLPRIARLARVAYILIDRSVLLLGFVVIASGTVVFGGVFRGRNIFNGLAHFIKGGIFFWYGLLTLGRWLGCFAELGWAWNIKPSKAVFGQRKTWVPSAELVESFVIFFYGASNVFLEHLNAWGGAWTAQDLEHVSISIMFFGGGLCGMLVESSRVRRLLNTTILLGAGGTPFRGSTEPWQPPKTYGFSMNPMPGLTILLLGLMMSSHHQNSMVATMVHKQWGMLLVGFALARAVTYLIFYISPPSSLLPSRPPSELIASFCLISGGLIFMASNKNTVEAMEYNELDAMFTFTVTMGFTAFLMAWAMVVLAIKGWAARIRQPQRVLNQSDAFLAGHEF